MNSKEIEALKNAKKKDEYQKLLITHQRLVSFIVANKMPKNEKGLPKKLWEYDVFFVRELLLLMTKFKNDIYSGIAFSRIESLLRAIYEVDNICLCIKEEDILPLSPFISEEEFIERGHKNLNPLLSEFFTNRKLMEIINKIENMLLSDDPTFNRLFWCLKYSFSLEERIMYFSQDVNFAIDIGNYFWLDVKGEGYKLSYQTSFNLNPSLFPSIWFEEYLSFLEGKIDPDLHTELYLTYCG